VLGSPRSGTTFVGGAIGTLPGFVDLGEVAALKAAIPELGTIGAERAAQRVRRILGTARRLGLVGSARAVEHTPETAFAVETVLRAFPEARIVHPIRDGRDVVCSLLEQGWLSAGRSGSDDAWLPFGSVPRFWVEPERAVEFAAGSDARRAAWAWRRYVSAARRASGRVFEYRYEHLASDPDAVARELANFLAVPAEPLARVLGRAHGGSVGRWERELSPDELEDVLAESGDLLEELGYV
jgi:sulfotransferase family protein